jgi:hypothetical protein
MGQPSSLIKLVETGLQSVDAKNGVQGRYRTAKFLLSLREKLSIAWPNTNRNWRRLQGRGPLPDLMNGDACSRPDNLRTHQYRAYLARNLEQLPLSY